MAVRSVALAVDQGLWSMFLHADKVVQSVMLVLALASLLTWTVLVAKAWELRQRTSELRRAVMALPETSSWGQLAEAPDWTTGIAYALVAAAQAELRQSAGLNDKAGIKERLGSRLERIELASARQLRQGIGLLATIGAVAPFVGLFGTVWGIMNSFIGIAHAHTTDLAVVAPGIAEALQATALGLVAAIPAVVIYNYFTRRLMNLRGLLGDLSAGLQQQVSRDLDRVGSLAASRMPH